MTALMRWFSSCAPNAPSVATGAHNIVFNMAAATSVGPAP
jgi:hypothetical protein